MDMKPHQGANFPEQQDNEEHILPSDQLTAAEEDMQVLLARL